MKLITLSEIFYEKYSGCKEILKKPNRPYLCLMLKVHDKTFAIPLRHHISHCYAFITIKDQGLDFTKAVPVEPQDISEYKPWIDTKEWDAIKHNITQIERAFKNYLKAYKRAQKKNDPRNANLLRFSALKYFDI